MLKLTRWEVEWIPQWRRYGGRCLAYISRPHPNRTASVHVAVALWFIMITFTFDQEYNG